MSQYQWNIINNNLKKIENNLKIRYEFCGDCGGKLIRFNARSWRNLGQSIEVFYDCSEISHCEFFKKRCDEIRGQSYEYNRILCKANLMKNLDIYDLKKLIDGPIREG